MGFEQDSPRQGTEDQAGDESSCTTSVNVDLSNGIGRCERETEEWNVRKVVGSYTLT